MAFEDLKMTNSMNAYFLVPLTTTRLQKGEMIEESGISHTHIQTNCSLLPFKKDKYELGR